MDPKVNLVKLEDKDIMGVTEYKSLIGSIMYAMLGMRPDLGYAILTLSKFNDCQDPSNTKPESESFGIYNSLKTMAKYLRPEMPGPFRSRYVIRTRIGAARKGQASLPGDTSLSSEEGQYL